MYRLCALAFGARIDGTPQCADTLIGLSACHGWSSTHGAKAPDAEGTKTTRKQLDELIKADSLASDLNAEDRDNASLHQDVEAAGWSGTVSAEVPADESLGVKGRLEQVIVKKAHIGFCWGLSSSAQCTLILEVRNLIITGSQEQVCAPRERPRTAHGQGNFSNSRGRK